MEPAFQSQFLDLWQQYFPGAELPLGFYYTEATTVSVPSKDDRAAHCLIATLNQVRQGHSLAFDQEHVHCNGGKRYLGFTQSLRPKFEYFLACGIPGEMEGERYKQSPELVLKHLQFNQAFQAPAKYIVFKRWDQMAAGDNPAVIIFFAPPDVLAGLFTLANFDEVEPHAVIAPFSSGCGSIVHYPYLESRTGQPRAVLGMFDISARPYLPASVLSLAIPWAKFQRMVENMPASFLITSSWRQIKSRW